MNAAVVPDTYAAWRHCIEVDCGLRLDAAYVQQRIAALGNPVDFHTQQFVRRWGDVHRRQVLDWFRQAQRELGTVQST